MASVDQCLFYHTMELPGLGVMEGLWDLRADVDKYLGHTDLKGKRVLEVGTASGYLCYPMESKGADVVAFELAPDETADIVPFARASFQQMAADMQPWMENFVMDTGLPIESLTLKPKSSMGIFTTCRPKLD